MHIIAQRLLRLGSFTFGSSSSTLCVVVVLGITEAFKADGDSRKMNLGVGAYRAEVSMPCMVLPPLLLMLKLMHCIRSSRCKCCCNHTRSRNQHVSVVRSHAQRARYRRKMRNTCNKIIRSFLIDLISLVAATTQSAR
jgi:hypothetical protein